MGAGVASALVEAQILPGVAPGQGQGLEASDWERAAQRVIAYLGAMGIREPREQALLREQVRLRVEARAVAVPLEDPVEAAIEETHALLDLWIASELGLEGDADTVFAARAAVLGGGVPGWSARWAGLAERSLANEIRALCVAPVPEPAPLTMEPNSIDLFMHRMTGRIAAILRCVLGRSAGPSPRTRGHS